MNTNQTVLKKYLKTIHKHVITNTKSNNIPHPSGYDVIFFGKSYSSNFRSLQVFIHHFCSLKRTPLLRPLPAGNTTLLLGSFRQNQLPNAGYFDRGQHDKIRGPVSNCNRKRKWPRGRGSVWIPKWRKFLLTACKIHFEINNFSLYTMTSTNE